MTNMQSLESEVLSIVAHNLVGNAVVEPDLKEPMKEEMKSNEHLYDFNMSDIGELKDILI